MSNLYSTLGRSLFFGLDAERAHGLSINALKTGLYFPAPKKHDPRLRVELAGLDFANPIGMAAGYDKNGDVPDALIALGFGHTEVGTITPKPQPGNPKPRIFRLIEDRGVINRLGFNSKGHSAAKANLRHRKRGNGIVGINLGANKESQDFASDYVEGINQFADVADYFTVNISSPNTPGLRALQGKAPLDDLLARVGEAIAEYTETNARNVPVFLKIAPDLTNTELDEISAAVEKSSLSGVIVSNTTLARDGLKSSNKRETGGLSGRPLFESSTIVLARMRQRLDARLPLIGVGGVEDATTAFAKLEAGATLVQLYSGMIYKGPGLAAEITKGLSRILDEQNIPHIRDIVGRKIDDWAAKTLPCD